MSANPSVASQQRETVRKTVSELKKRLRTATPQQRNHILWFLAGWCEDDKQFAEGLRAALAMEGVQ